MSIAIICIALNALLVFLLGFLVTLRRSTGDKVVYYGDVLDPASPLAKAQRAHGNASEYAGAVTALFLICILTKHTGAWIPALMVVITAARYLHVFGFLTCKTLSTPHWAKATGALVTYVGGISLAVYIVGYEISGFFAS